MEHVLSNEAAAAITRERLRRAWWAVVALFLVHGLVVSTWVSRIAAVKMSLRLSDGTFGVALFASAVGALLAIPVSGWSIDKYGSKAAVLWTATGLCISVVLLAYAPNFVALSLALFLYGAMTGANDVSINAQAVGVEKHMDHPTMSRFHAMFSLGGIAGAGMGAVVASAGVGPKLHFTVAAISIGLLVAVATPHVLDSRRAAKDPAARLLRKPPVALVALSAVGFCIFLSEGAIGDWSAIFITQVLQAGEGTAAAAYAVFSAAMTVFRLAGDAITHRLGRAAVIRLGGTVAALGLALVVISNSPAMALAGFAISGAGFSSIIPVVFAAGGRIPSVSEAAGVATVSGIGYAGFLVGPPVIGFVSELWSLRVGLAVLVALSLAATLLVSIVTRSASNPLGDPKHLPS